MLPYPQIPHGKPHLSSIESDLCRALTSSIRSRFSTANPQNQAGGKKGGRGRKKRWGRSGDGLAMVVVDGGGGGEQLRRLQLQLRVRAGLPPAGADDDVGEMHDGTRDQFRLRRALRGRYPSGVLRDRRQARSRFALSTFFSALHFFCLPLLLPLLNSPSPLSVLWFQLKDDKKEYCPGTVAKLSPDMQETSWDNRKGDKTNATKNAQLSYWTLVTEAALRCGVKAPCIESRKAPGPVVHIQGSGKAAPSLSFQVLHTHISEFSDWLPQGEAERHPRQHQVHQDPVRHGHGQVQLPLHQTRFCEPCLGSVPSNLRLVLQSSKSAGARPGAIWAAGSRARIRAGRSAPATRT